jgi:hypothetical protein
MSEGEADRGSRRWLIGWLRSCKSATSSGIRWHFAVVIGLLLAAGTLYVGLFALLYRGKQDAELHFGVAGSVRALDLYLDVLSLDPVREAIKVRIENFRPSESLWWRTLKPEEVNDFVINLDDRYYGYQIAVEESGAKTVQEITLDGSISGYPLDQYTGRVSIRASNKVTGTAEPIHLTVWPFLSNWDVEISRFDQALETPSKVDLTIQVKRPASFIVMAFALYAAVALIGLSGFTIGTLVFLGVRPLREEGMLGALGAMIFAIPALRGIMPGAPPLGILADALILLWAQMAPIIGLTLFVITWVSRPRTAGKT